MGLLTDQESKAKKKKVHAPSVHKRQKVTVPIQRKPEPIFEYLLFHPENPSDNYVNTKYTTKINGKDEIINVQNGQVRTVMEHIADHLKKVGYSLIKKTLIKEI